MYRPQVCKTFEDLYAEALRINAGRPSLAPYASVAHKEVDCQEGGSAGDATKPAERGPCRHALPVVREEGGADPASVLAAAYDVESSSSPPSSRGAAAAAAARTGVRSHPIGSLLDFAYLAGATSASLAAEAAASAAAAAAEAAAAAAKEAEAAALSWRTRVYGWLQRLWLASNAALGMAPDAVAQLEEMAVLV
jgi:pyruvate/2-oxoglutarate dehydrogenase complex dihydrolipoamide acyltransferase (E2) component